MSTSPKLTLYTNHLTPNGLKVSIYLEELKAVDPSIDYRIEMVDLPNQVNKEPWFIKMNPNGKIPVLVDHARDNFTVFESAAILLYLEQHYDKQKHFSFDYQKNPDDYSRMLQWIFVAHGGVGPMQGQTHFFLHYSPEDIPYAKQRFVGETKRLYGVLDIGLSGRDWFVGPGRGTFTIADANVLPWLRFHDRAGIENLDQWPNLKAWFYRSLDRPGVQAAIKSVTL